MSTKETMTLEQELAELLRVRHNMDNVAMGDIPTTPDDEYAWQAACAEFMRKHGAHLASQPAEQPRGDVLGYLYIGKPREDGWQPMDFARMPWDGAMREVLDRQGVEEIPVGRVTTIQPKPEQSNYPEIPDSSNPEQAVGDGVVALPPIVREVLEWYASAPTIWVAWNEAGWAEEEAAKASGHYTFIGEDDRGHNQYVPNHVRAEEALDALIEWQESLPRPAVATPAEVTDGSIKRYRVRLVPEASALDGFVAAMVEDTSGDMVSYVDHCAALAAQPSAVGVPEERKASLYPDESREDQAIGAAYDRGWNDCRKAILATAPEVPSHG